MLKMNLSRQSLIKEEAPWESTHADNADRKFARVRSSAQRKTLLGKHLAKSRNHKFSGVRIQPGNSPCGRIHGKWVTPMGETKRSLLVVVVPFAQTSLGKMATTCISYGSGGLSGS